MSNMVLMKVVLSFPHLVTMWSGRPDIEPSYNCNLILPQDFAQWAELQANVNEAVAAKFGSSPPANLKLPWLNKYLQPKVRTEGQYSGCYFLAPSTKQNKPVIVDQNVQPVPDLQVKELFFAGCIVNVEVGFAGYGTAADGGAGIYLNKVQLVNNQVEPLVEGQDKAASEVFQKVAGAPAPLAPPVTGLPPGVAPVTGLPPGAVQAPVAAPAGPSWD